MGSRFLSIVIALSMLAVVSFAFPAEAAVDYTGSIATTDNAKSPRDVFVQGQNVYVVCEVLYLEVHSAEAIEVRLETVDGSLVSHFHATADIPEVGWYNSSEVGAMQLSTSAAPIPWGQDRAVFYVVLEEDSSGYEISRTPITVLKQGLTLDPPSGIVGTYCPGQTITAKLTTPFEQDILYVHTVNSTGADVPGMNWSTVIAIGGIWDRIFTLAVDMPDGVYSMKARDSTTHAIRHTIDFAVQKYVLEVGSDRSYYLTGETASIQYLVVELETLAECPDVQVAYQAHWVNSSGADCYQSGGLPGSSGIHSVAISSDVASYSDVWLTYWANDTESSRSVQTWTTLSTGELRAEVWLSDDNTYPGGSLSVEVWAGISWDNLPGAEVDIVVEVNGTQVAGLGAAGLLTDSGGMVGHTIALSPTALAGTYVVTAEVSKAGHSATRMVTFAVDYIGWIEVEFDSAYYLSGDAATIHWRAVWNNEALTGVNALYTLQFGSSEMILGNDGSGVIAFAVPSDFSGFVQASVMANHDGYYLYGAAIASVYLAELQLVALDSSYRPGDSIDFGYSVATNLATAEMSWEITDSTDMTVATGTPAMSETGTFAYEVPLVFASPWYNARMTIVSQSVVVATDEVSLVEAPEPPLLPLPYIVVDRPAEGLVTNISAVEVSGTVEPGAWLTVNGLTVQQGPSGGFSVVVNLIEGSNLITVSADDGMGNVRHITRNVSFDNPIPELQAELAQAMLDLAAIETNLATALQQLDDVGQTLLDIWSDLNTSDALLAALEAELEGLWSELAAAQAELNGTQDQLLAIDALQNELDDARSSLNATIAALEAAQEEIDALENELDETQLDIEDSADGTSPLVWAVAAIAVSILGAAAVSLLVVRRSPKS